MTQQDCGVYPMMQITHFVKSFTAVNLHKSDTDEPKILNGANHAFCQVFEYGGIQRTIEMFVCPKYTNF